MYDEIMLDHCKTPRNFRVMTSPSSEARAANPLCGDEIVLYLRIEDGLFTEVTFQGRGCAIAKASASLMTEALTGKTREQVQTIAQAFEDMLNADDAPVEPDPELGHLAAFQSLRSYATRIKCAMLPWRALGDALSR